MAENMSPPVVRFVRPIRERIGNAIQEINAPAGSMLGCFAGLASIFGCLHPPTAVTIRGAIRGAEALIDAYDDRPRQRNEEEDALMRATWLEPTSQREQVDTWIRTQAVTGARMRPRIHDPRIQYSGHI